jgi:hypothetical protein
VNETIIKALHLAAAESRSVFLIFFNHCNIKCLNNLLFFFQKEDKKLTLCKLEKKFIEHNDNQKASYLCKNKKQMLFL